jgi:ABC-type glycerol-3-phosphate transport system permease component
MTNSAVRHRSRPAAIGLYTLVVLITVSVALPLLWIGKLSIVERRELTASPPTIWPQSSTWDHYATVLGDSLFLHALLNSLIIAGTTTIICVVLGAMAGYALGRLRFRFRTTLLAGLLGISFFPMVAVIAPLFVQFRQLNILNTYAAVVLTDSAFGLPLCVWIMAAFFRQLPSDLEQAAWVDGATRFQAFRLIIVPLAAPGLATAAILSFIVNWNEFLFANTFLFAQDKWPVTVLIPNFSANQFTPDYGAQAAASLIVTLPMVVLVLVFQRRIISGLTAGSVTG